MGGNVAWTIRKEDGEEFRMDRWTNIFCNGGLDLITDAFLAGDPDSLDGALSSWLDMKADWEANSATGKFMHNMTEVYAPYPYGLRPSEYGFIVTDFVTKTIISVQGYATIGSMNIHKALLKNDLSGKRDGRGRPLADQYARLQYLFDQGRIREYLSFEHGVLPIGDMSLKDVLRAIFSQPYAMLVETLPVRFPEPWKLLTFSEDRDGRAGAYAAVKSLGFVLSAAEEADFSAWVSDDEDEI